MPVELSDKSPPTCDKVQSRKKYTKPGTRSVESNEAAEGGVVVFGGKDFEKRYTF